MNPTPPSATGPRAPFRAQRPFSVPADSLPHIVWTAGAAGEIDRWNIAWAEYTGTDPAESTGWSWLELVDPVDRDSVRVRWAENIAAKEPFDLRFRLWSRSENGYRPQLARAAPTRDLSDAVVGWTGTITDMHDPPNGETGGRANGGDELAAARIEVERANQELQQFAYAASHDMREPLRMVTSYLNLLERRYAEQLDQTAIDYIKFAVEGSARMSRLIDDLLAYSRVVGAESFNLRPVNMAGVTQWVLMNLTKEVAESGAKVTWEELPTVNADENRIVMVVQHLISNSLKFRGDEPPLIRITAEERENEWVFAVIDNGSGFDQQYADRVFSVFKRLHSKQYPGTGMGLAIAKKIIERHGGRMWAESAVGQGARFYFTLPF